MNRILTRLAHTSAICLIFTLTISLTLCLPCQGQKPHPVPKLKDLHRPWVFARASEASTLFIEPHFKNTEPYAHIVQTAKTLEWLEFDGRAFHKWKILKYTESDKELTLYLTNGEKVLIVPYWDIDHCLLMIRFAPKSDTNPTRFAVPYQLLPSIPYMEAEK